MPDSLAVKSASRHLYAAIGAERPVRIRDEADAVQKTLKAELRTFRTFEQTEVEMEDGERIKGARLQESPAHLVGFDRVLTRNEAAAKIRKSSQSLTDEFYDVASMAMGKLRALPEDAVFVENYPGGYSPYLADFGIWPVEKGGKVFDKAGGQVWPQPQLQAPAPRAPRGFILR